MKTTHKPPQGVRVISEIRTQKQEIQAYIQKYYISKNRKQATITVQRYALEILYNCTDKYKPEELTLEDLEIIPSYCRKDLKLDPATINTNVLARIKTYLKRRGCYELAEAIKELRVREPEKYYDTLTQAEIKQIYQSIGQRTYHHGEYQKRLYRAIFTLALNTGQRREAIAQLNLEDLDLENKQIMFIRGMKNDRIHRSRIMDICVKHILEYLDLRPTTLKNEPALFVSPQKYERITGKYVNNTVKTLVAGAGINKKITAHSIRRTFIELADTAGLSMEDQKAGTGHKKMQTLCEYHDKLKPRIIPEDSYNAIFQGVYGDVVQPEPLIKKPGSRRPILDNGVEDLIQRATEKLLEGAIDKETFKLIIATQSGLVKNNESEVKMNVPGYL